MPINIKVGGAMLSLHTTVYDYRVDKAHTQSFYVTLL